MQLALRGLKVGPDDEVLLAGYDFPGNFRSIEAIGARPVLVDIDPRTWSLDAGQLERAIGPQTRAVVVSHLHGGHADMATLHEIAQRRGLVVVEDACQATGARVQGRIAGTWGDVGVLSFGGSKLLTAGRGGALITSRDDVLQRIKVFCEQGNHAFPLSELQAAVLLPQLDTLEERNRTRLARARRLIQKCGDTAARLKPVTLDQPGAEPSFYKLAWLYDPGQGPPRADFLARTQAAGIELDAGFRGFVRRGSRRCRRGSELEHSARAAENTVLLHHPWLLQSEEMIDRIAAAIREAMLEADGKNRGRPV